LTVTGPWHTYNVSVIMKQTGILLLIIALSSGCASAKKEDSGLFEGRKQNIRVYVDSGGKVTKHIVDYKKGITLADVITSIGGFPKYAEDYIWVIQHIRIKDSAFVVNVKDDKNWGKTKMTPTTRVFIFMKLIIF